MLAPDQLWESYERWRKLTHLEGAALVGAQWGEVRRIQEQKHLLQAEIIRLTDMVVNRITSRLERDNFTVRLRSTVNELILLETKNQKQLEFSLKTAQENRRELDVTSNRLRQMHAAYVPSQPPVWENRS